MVLPNLLTTHIADEILPNTTYQHIWQYLDATEQREVAAKMMLRLLKLATDQDCEEVLGQHVLSLIENKSRIDIQMIERDFNGSHLILPVIDCKQHTLAHYDNYIPHKTTTIGEKQYATL